LIFSVCLYVFALEGLKREVHPKNEKFCQDLITIGMKVNGLQSSVVWTPVFLISKYGVKFILGSTKLYRFGMT